MKKLFGYYVNTGIDPENNVVITIPLEDKECAELVLNEIDEKLSK